MRQRIYALAALASLALVVVTWLMSSTTAAGPCSPSPLGC